MAWFRFFSGIVFCCYNCLDLPWEKFFQVWVTFFPSSWEQEYCVEKRLCKFETLGQEFVTFSRHYSCLRELGKKVTNTWKNFEHDTNLDNYSNRMFFLIFLELYLLDLCVDMADSFPNGSLIEVWKIFLTCEEKYFSSHVMDFSVKKKIEVLTKRSQQVRNNKEN